MFKRCFPLALVLAWIPNAYAFPPCPQAPVELDPIDSDPIAPIASSTDKAVWFKSQYALVGNPLVTDLLGPDRRDMEVPSDGKCHDRLLVPDSHASDGVIDLNPVYAPASGFGIVALPDLRYMATGLNVRYAVSFEVDSRLLRAGDWLDIAQLEFRWNDDTTLKYPRTLATVYRVRKIQHDTAGPAIEVIESRTASGDTDTESPLFETVVANIPISANNPATPITLRWSQRTVPHDHAPADGNTPVAGIPGAIATIDSGFLGPPIVSQSAVESFFEVLDQDRKVLYSVALHRQWAGTLSMGLLDYNASRNADYIGDIGAEMMNTSLSAEELL